MPTPAINQASATKSSFLGFKQISTAPVGQWHDVIISRANSIPELTASFLWKEEKEDKAETCSKCLPGPYTINKF